MIIGYVQTNPTFGEKERNFNQVESLLKGNKADIIVLPELFATGYTFISKDEAISLSEELNGATADFLIQQAQTTGAIIVAGFIEKDGSNIFNSALIVSEDSVIGTYRKIHLYYKEKKWFSPGNRTIKIFDLGRLKLGVMICFDWIFPETARSLAILGADIITHPANLVLPYCQKAMVTRCLENRVFAVTANRIGRETRGVDDFEFTGASQITSFNGNILSSAPKDTIYADFIEIEIKNARNKSLNDFNNVFEDRKPSYYHI